MDEEEEFWRAVKGSKAVEDLQSYLEAYPKGRFALIARVKIRQLKRKSAPKPVAVAPPKPAPPPRVTYPRRITGISRVREVYQGKWSWTVKSNGATGWSVNRADGYVRAWMARNKWEAVGEWWATEQGLCTRYRKFRKGQTHCFTLTEVAPNKFITKNVVNGAEVILRKLNSFSQGTVPSKISRPRVTYPRRITGRSRLRSMFPGKWSWTVKSNGATGWGEYKENGDARIWNAKNWRAEGKWWPTDQGTCTHYRKYRKGRTNCYTLTEVAPNKFITKNVVNGAEVILRKLNSFSQGTVPSKISRPRVTYPRRITGRSRLRSMFPGKWSWTVKSNGATGWGEYKENGDARTWMANKWEAKGQWWATNQGTCTRYRKFRKGRTNCFTLTEVAPNKFISKNNVTGSEVILRKIE